MTHSYATFHRCEHPRPSNDVILRLIEHYPNGLKQKDKDGNLAIHSACENNAPNDKVILKMIEFYADGVTQKDKDGKEIVYEGGNTWEIVYKKINAAKDLADEYSSGGKLNKHEIKVVRLADKGKKNDSDASDFSDASESEDDRDRKRRKR